MPLTAAVIGDALLDVSIAPLEPVRRGGDVIATVRLGSGGQGANLAVRLARQGARVRLACGLADDAVGRLVREALEAEGIELLAVPVPASGAVAIVVQGGERTMLSQRTPFGGRVDVPTLVAGAAWLVISGYVLLEDDALELARRCGTLRARRAVLGCDVPTDRLAHWGSALSAARPDVVFLNGDEADALEGAEDLGTIVVVTGPDSVRATGAGLALALAAEPGADAPVDTTGAGDAFAAAVLAELGSSWPPKVEVLRAALTEGMAFARRVVAVAGAQAIVAGERVAAP